MAAMHPVDRYTRTAIALHWTIAALILFNLWLGFAHDALPRDWRVMPVHKAIGMLVLALSLVRLGWRLAHRVPDPAPGTPRWTHAAATAAHWLFYVLLIALPVTGWLMVSGAAVRRPLTFFGLFDIPYLPVGRAANQWGGEAHEIMGFLMAGLLILHVAAALWHHFGRRDATLAHMIPWLRRTT
jgi:cytochrome b561